MTQQTEIIVETMKEFEDKSHFLIARSLNDMVDDVVWAQFLNHTLEPKKVYEIARIACAENIEKRPACARKIKRKNMLAFTTN